MTQPHDFPIVGVGASAGGVEALEGFFRGLPADPGVGVVVVTHLSAERESMLHDIIARYTSLPVHIATNDAEVLINHVYVLPADAVLSIENRRLQIRKNSSRRERKPIDIFFSSLAVDVEERAIGIVLSGGDGDGTLGAKAIKERGGLTLAQIADGFGPQHPDMPNAAISSGFVDFAVPVDQMGAKVVQFAHSKDLLEEIVTTEGVAEEPPVEQAMPEIYGILRNQVGHDFSGYKTSTFMRRVQRRMQVTQIPMLDEYVERLRQEPQEVGALFRDLLISVTNFFRDNEAFESLASIVVPRLFEGRGAEDTVRVWIPGCSTGEEVFSIGILIREYMDQLTAVPRVQIFATDIDERALVVARAARYPAALLDKISAERRKRFFIPDGSSFVISKDVRELCIFSPHSVIRDPPFSRIDLVSCRNLLIYFGIDVQNQVIPTFFYALRPNGYLFLGSAENVTQFDDLFVPVEKRHRIFRRRSDVVPALRLPMMVSNPRISQIAELTPRPAPMGAIALRQAVDEQVSERFSPPHVLINREGDVVYVSTRTGKYLEVPAGVMTRQLLSMARRDLRLDLRTLFREAVESNKLVRREGVAIEGDNGSVQLLDLVIEPLTANNGAESLYLVLFIDQGPPLSREDVLSRTIANQSSDGVPSPNPRNF